MFSRSLVSNCVAAILAALFFHPFLAASPGRPTVEDFFRQPAVATAKLNPSGTHLALRTYDLKTDSAGIRIIDLDAKTATSLAGDKTYDVSDFAWVDDDRIVFTVIRNNLFATGLLLTHRDLKSRPRMLNENDVARFISAPKNRRDRIYVWVQREARNEGRVGALVELNLAQGGKRGFDVEYGPLVADTLAAPPGYAMRGWLPDREGEIRYAVAEKDGRTILIRREAGDSWTPLSFDLDQFHFLGIDNDTHFLFVARRTPNGLRELVRLDTRDGSTGPVIYTDPKYDFGQGLLNLSADRRHPASLGYSRHAPQQISLTPEESALHQMIDAALPADRINLIVGRNKNDSRLLVHSSSDRHPPSYYLFEPAEQRLRLVGESAPWLQDAQMGPVRTMSFTARDGLVLDGYVTLPPDYVPGKPAPMVVLAHGGPWARDNWGFHAESQFFASRGYLVFRPNYRGSSGYNADISEKPYLEFRQMHDDVTDGVQTLIKAGIADPAHLAIVGGSFGGYLAVCGAAFEPNLYQCAVTIAGVFDWERAIGEWRHNTIDTSRYDFYRRNLGNPAKQAAKFEAMSPLRSADKIRIPVFIAHGKEDRAVDSEQSYRLAKTLKQVGVPYETMFEEMEGHGFFTLENRVELYTRIEAFLKKHL